MDNSCLFLISKHQYFVIFNVGVYYLVKNFISMCHLPVNYSGGWVKVNEYTTDIAKEILDKLQDKGWNLYKALKFEDTVDPTETIRRGPVSELEKNATYIVLPAVEESQSPAAVQDALRGLTKKTGGHILLPHGEEGIDLQALILREFDVGIPLEKFIAGIPYTSFIEQLDRLFDTRLERQINYSKIDPPIRELVQKLNQVSFVYTLKSRAGRLRREINRDLSKDPLTETEKLNCNITLTALPDEDSTFITNGYVLFKIADSQISDVDVAYFLSDVKELADQYSFTSLSCVNKEWTFLTECKDLTDSHAVDPDDSFIEKVKKLHQITEKKAHERLHELHDVKDKLIKIAERYS